VIAEVVRGNDMPALISYLFGPGRHNEHVNQHLIAGYAEAVFSAPGRLWQSEPGVQRKVQREARELGWEVEYPRSRWDAEVSRGYVWHCSLALKAEEGQLTDTQWTEAAHSMVEALGLSGSDGKAPCRWVAVRHGLSSQGNDHIHIAVNLVREDGTKASTWNDYRKAGQVCAEMEERFGLEHVPGRMAGQSVPEPSRADREISAARGEPEPLRARLERKVRACAAAAQSEAHFLALARSAGLLVRPRYARDDPARVTGYAVAERDGRQAYSSRTGTTGPVWFGGGKLASDLALPGLRARWQVGPGLADAEALAAWAADTAITAGIAPRRSPVGRLSLAGVHADMGTAAGLLAAAATGIEGTAPGPLSRAARHMARAAQYQPGLGNHGATEVIGEMAEMFMFVTMAGTSAGPMMLVDEVIRLSEECAARAATGAAQREAQQASVLARASLATLTQAASQQAAATLTATTTGGAAMSEPAHEDQFLEHITQTVAMIARLTRLARTRARADGTGASYDIAGLRAAGYTEHTRHDAVLRHLLGEQRWAAYAADPARVAAAAAITNGDAAGYDMPALLAKVIGQRRWETDDRSPSRSVAEVLHYRVTRELARTSQNVDPTPAPQAASSREDRRSRPVPRTPARPPIIIRRDPARPAAVRSPEPGTGTPYDGKLRELLGEHRWQQYAADSGRRDVAALILRAHGAGRDVGELLTAVVTMRPFEDDPVSPARNVADVLHHRLDRALSDSPRHDGQGSAARQLPDEITGLLAHGTAPAGSQPRQDGLTDPAEQQAPLSARQAGRPHQGSDGR
jgi:hypothetical protein